MAGIVEYLKLKDAIYDVDDVIYLLNPNDFSRYNSIYEGADNGMYRSYRRPTVMSLWFVRKAVYRAVKRGPSSVRWYKWFFAGNEEIGYGHLRELAAYAEANGARFSVVLMPAGIAYGDDGYALADMYGRIGAFLRAEGILHVDPTGEFGANKERYFDHTDHFYPAGNERMAQIMGNLIRNLDGKNGASARRGTPAPGS